MNAILSSRNNPSLQVAGLKVINDLLSKTSHPDRYKESGAVNCCLTLLKEEETDCDAHSAAASFFAVFSDMSLFIIYIT